jgi:hypothetical protein
MYSLVWFRTLGQGSQELWRRSVIRLPNLATVTPFDVIGDVLIHPRPEVVHRDPSLGFAQAIMSGQKLTMGFLQDEGYQSFGH